MAFSYAGLDHVQVAAPVGTEAEMRKFFGELLGMRELEKPEALKKNGGAWFQCGAQQLHVGVEQEFAPAKKAHPAFLVDNIRELREHLIANGVTVKDDKNITDVMRFFIADPWGNRLEFMERV
ncbi:MAG TPA: VOC family protein [Bacilli bacterium]|nr:VOC family protein [Bacilli bacterium]